VYQKIDEPIDVIVVFEKDVLQPARFRWRGETYKIGRITGSWIGREVQGGIRHFSVVDTHRNVFFLEYNTRLTRWVISKRWVE
jgi:hypothetical protein